ncbi:MAG: prepilin-type N-terminal cleavage/methylation domain-containing protein [Hydrogenoanaerobacterium sp.]
MLKKYKGNKNGFTLVEVIVVLVILAILAAISFPALTGYIDRANEAAAIEYGRTVLIAAQTLASKEYSAGTKPKDIVISDTEIANLSACDKISFKENIKLNENTAKVEAFKVYYSPDGASPGTASKIISYTIAGGFKVG